MKRNLRISSIIIITILIACIMGLIAVMSTSFIKPRTNYASLGSIDTRISGLKNNETDFFRNDNEDLLKETGLMGTIVRKIDDGSIISRNLYTVAAVNNELTTTALTLDNVDYSVVDDEIHILNARLY